VQSNVYPLLQGAIRPGWVLGRMRLVSSCGTASGTVLLIGLGEGEFPAPVTPPLAGFTRTILPMKDGEVAC